MYKCHNTNTRSHSFKISPLILSPKCSIPTLTHKYSKIQRIQHTHAIPQISSRILNYTCWAVFIHSFRCGRIHITSLLHVMFDFPITVSKNGRLIKLMTGRTHGNTERDSGDGGSCLKQGPRQGERPATIETMGMTRANKGGQSKRRRDDSWQYRGSGSCGKWGLEKEGSRQQYRVR